MRELKCIDESFAAESCCIEIKWELLDRYHDKVVYAVSTRAVEHNIPKTDTVERIRGLILSTLKSLMSRERFIRTLSITEEPKKEQRVTFRGYPLGNGAVLEMRF